MKQYIVDAFADKVFCGNQAAVCVLDSWISDSLMQNIAKENNFSETAIRLPSGLAYCMPRGKAGESSCQVRRSCIRKEISWNRWEE